MYQYIVIFIPFFHAFTIVVFFYLLWYDDPKL